jgi:hypothetical protein
MVSIKQGVENAILFALETLGEGRIKGIRLEEVDTSTIAGEEAWLITLSMPSPDAESWAVALGGRGSREYKSFTVLKNSGEVTSMKIRELADA